MARLALHPIGSALNAAAAAANREAMTPLKQRLLDKREAVHSGWGASYIERVPKKGKLTAWERIERLIDAGSRPLAVGTLVNDGELFGPEQRPAPGAGVVTPSSPLSCAPQHQSSPPPVIAQVCCPPAAMAVAETPSSK